MAAFPCVFLVAAAAAARFVSGPFANPDDQFRFMWGTDRDSSGSRAIPLLYDKMVATGFNLLIPYLGSHLVYDTVADKPLELSDGWHASLSAYLDRCYADGISVMAMHDIGRRRPLVEKFPRYCKDGSKSFNLDAANPHVREVCARAAAAAARSMGCHPAVIGAMVESEIRDGAHPSFTPETAKAYRAHSGRDIPPEVVSSPSKNGRQPPHWKTIHGFPADRVVDDDFPVLDFYVWLWKKGDGWKDWITACANAVASELGPGAVTMYDPSLRTPPMWDSVGDVSVFDNWTYVYPEPYNISYETSRQISRASRRKQDVWAHIQSISYRSHLAPVGIHPDGEPEWTVRFPTESYPTTPPDLVQEAMWVAFSRRVDGVGTGAYRALYELPRDVNYKGGYCCATPKTCEVIRETFRAVGEPLGPLFRAIPERAPKVAVVESYASMILGSRITWDCGGKFGDYGTALTAANLMPASLNEDEIRQRGVPDSVEVLVMCQCDVLTRKCYERLAGFKKRGGMILADDELCPALAADGKLPPIVRAFPETKSDHDEGNGVVVSTAEAREKSIREASAKLKDLVAPRVVPYADTDKPDILASVRTYRNADYVFAINDRRGYGDYVGAWKRVKEKGLPNSGVVTVCRSAGAVYDLVRHSAVPFKSERGKTSVKVDFATNDGRVLLVVPRPLSPLSISVAKDGEVVVTSPDKDVMIPIEVVCDGAKPRYGVVEDGVWKRPYKKGANLRVRNLADATVFRR